MLSPAENPIIDKFLDDHADKLGSYDAAWAAAEQKFDVIRPRLGDAATFGAGIERPSPVDWDMIADQEGGLEFGYSAPARTEARNKDHAMHASNNRLSGVMSSKQKLAQQAINARRPKMPWE